ncbi:MAG: hypothetical protein WA809_10775 [Candidatus Dormiibacterota bacterium]
MLGIDPMSWYSNRRRAEPGVDSSGTTQRQVILRNEKRGADSRHLLAYLDDEGNLHIDGQDLGPATALVSDDGEYEWYRTIGHEDLPQLMGLLGAPADADLLDVLQERWSGARSYDFDKLLRESGIKTELVVG